MYQLLNSLGNPKLNDQCVNPTHAENSQDIANLLDARFKKKKKENCKTLIFAVKIVICKFLKQMNKILLLVL